MLEKYEKDFDENEFMRSFMERKQISTKKQALAELRKLIKKEGYYQTKIKEALKKRYPDAFVAKISQGAYSQAGICVVVNFIVLHSFSSLSCKY